MDKLYDLMVSSLICAPEKCEAAARALETKIQYARTREGARGVGEIARGGGGDRRFAPGALRV
jgi:hypothetical protein